MKKILLIIVTITVLPQLSHAGINFSGLPGAFAFDSLVSGKKHQAAVAGIADPGRAKTTPPLRRNHRSRLQPLFTSR